MLCRIFAHIRILAHMSHVTRDMSHGPARLGELRSALVFERETERKTKRDEERGRKLIFVRHHTCLHEFCSAVIV